jgi:hypothetical protein
LPSFIPFIPLAWGKFQEKSHASSDAADRDEDAKVNDSQDGPD